MVDVVVQNVFGGKEEGTMVALSPVALASGQPLGVTVVGVRVEGCQGAQQCRAELGSI